jgi:hypothetical protein
MPQANNQRDRLWFGEYKDNGQMRGSVHTKKEQTRHTNIDRKKSIESAKIGDLVL